MGHHGAGHAERYDERCDRHSLFGRRAHGVPRKAPCQWDGKLQRAVGADGWPSQSSFGNVFVTSSSDPSAPSLVSTWLMSWEGQATPTNLMPGSRVANLSYDPSTDTTTAALVVATSESPFIMFGFANASTARGGPGVKALKILQPGYGYAEADGFIAPLLALLARADLLRFMDWAHTNGNLIPRESAVAYATVGALVRAAAETVKGARRRRRGAKGGAQHRRFAARGAHQSAHHGGLARLCGHSCKGGRASKRWRRSTTASCAAAPRTRPPWARALSSPSALWRRC